jgi:hypothetical protein
MVQHVVQHAVSLAPENWPITGIQIRLKRVRLKRICVRADKTMGGFFREFCLIVLERCFNQFAANSF